MRIGAILSFITASGALGVGGYVFLTNSVPYVTVDQAIAQPHQQVHVAGEIMHQTVRSDVLKGQTEFQLKDDAGKTMLVHYKGSKPANFDEAPKVSVSGYYENGVFVSDKMLVKCPSKYESMKGQNPHEDK